MRELWDAQLLPQLPQGCRLRGLTGLDAAAGEADLPRLHLQAFGAHLKEQCVLPVHLHQRQQDGCVALEALGADGAVGENVS